jgi:hypothetical protein
MPNVRRFKAHPQSAPGDFYVVNDECVSCGAPHAAAPDLIGWATNVENEHCIWKKQPETPEELEQAFAAFNASMRCLLSVCWQRSSDHVPNRVGLLRSSCKKHETTVIGRWSPHGQPSHPSAFHPERQQAKFARFQIEFVHQGRLILVHVTVEISRNSSNLTVLRSVRR